MSDLFDRKPRIARRYIATWYVNVGPVSPSEVESYMESFKKNITRSGNGCFKDLTEHFGAPVMGFYIPTRNEKTHLEIREFTFEEEQEGDEAP